MVRGRVASALSSERDKCIPGHLKVTAPPKHTESEKLGKGQFLLCLLLLFSP